ncbi:MAG: hypothetical protein WKF85_10050 [Chitinophagaceae bacterium]
MKPFEITLIIVLFAFLLNWVINKKHRYFWYWSIVVAFAALLQIFIEGIRWQMFPAFILAMLFMLSFFFKSNVLRKIFFSSAILLFVIAAILPAFFPVFKFKKPARRFEIGTVTYHSIDTSRKEIFSDKGNRKREMMMQIWYPAKKNIQDKFAPYIEDAETFTPALAELFGYPKFFLAHLKYVKTNAISNAEISNAEEKFSVLIYHTGINGCRQLNTFQIQELVSQGYIVAGIDNPGAVALVQFPDGTFIKGLPIEKIQALTHQSIEDLNEIPKLNGIEMKDGVIPFFAEDISFVINCLEKINENDSKKILTHHIDTTKIGVFGVSLGGIVVAAAASKDNRIKACLIMESAMPKDVMLNGLKIPTMIMTRDVETMRLERKRSGGWTEKDIQQHQYSMKNIFDRLPSEGYFIQIPKMFHVDFTDLPLWFPYGKYLGHYGRS